jgi:hypothetical protein
MMSMHGSMKHVFLACWHSGRREQGFGTVRFHTVEKATEAIEKYNETDLEGRSLSVFVDKFA